MLIDRLFFHSKMVAIILREILFEKYYMSIAEIKDFNVLIDNKPFFDQPIKKSMRSTWKNCRNVKKQ